jgi:hypothetical protein
MVLSLESLGELFTITHGLAKPQVDATSQQIGNKFKPLEV